MLICAFPGCGRPRTDHSAEAPHGSTSGSGAICPGYVPQWPCGACGTDCELHEKDAPHPRIINEVVTCEAAVPPKEFSPGGGGCGGGGASGGW
jgi:uncharacterized membrane protein YgcG